MSLTLSPAELKELTDRHTRPAQCRRLRAMGIPFLHDQETGQVKVLRAVVEKKGGYKAPRPEQEQPAPDFAWMRKQA